MDGALLNQLYGVPFHVAHYTGGSYQTHYHRFLELIIVNADVGTNVIAGHRTPFRRRQVFQLGTFHPHRIEGQADGNCDYYNIMFLPEVAMTARPPGEPADVLALFYAPDPADAFLLPEDDYQRATRICESILAEIASPDRNTPAIVLGEAQALLALVARHREPAGALPDPRVITALRLIAERFDEQLPSRELAALVGVSPARLAQLFREYTGTTVRDAVMRRRLTEAKRLLAQTQIPITTLLYQCGFNDVSYFNRRFKADTGFTPRQFRRRAIR